MTITQCGLLTLLKSAITGEKLSLPEGFSLEDADGIISGQGLVTLAYVGADNCGISPETELMQRYRKQYFQALLYSEKQLRAVEQICHAFEEHSIDYMLLKGCNLKRLYPQPELRMMGDADILIRTEQYGKIRPVMEELGFSEEEETHHELTWRRADLYLELHKCLFPSVRSEFYPYFGDGWDRAVKQENSRYTMRHEDEFVFLFTHMAKHYSGSGIGSRQFLDLYVYRRAYPQMDEAYVEDAMAQIHLLEFYRNIRKLLAVWFDGEEPDEKTEFISRYILSGGSWGDMETRIYSEEARKIGAYGPIKHTRAKAMCKAIFPPLEKMQHEYSILLKFPYLYPLFWIPRWVKGILCRPGQIIKKMTMLQKMTDEKALARQRDLSYVGLDFHYNEAEQSPD